jgi:hypothetical protein
MRATLSSELEAEAAEVLDRLRQHYTITGVDIKATYEPFDAQHNGKVTVSQVCAFGALNAVTIAYWRVFVRPVSPCLPWTLNYHRPRERGADCQVRRWLSGFQLSPVLP